jgi:hypothetical protein
MIDGAILLRAVSHGIASHGDAASDAPSDAQVVVCQSTALASDVSPLSEAHRERRVEAGDAACPRNTIEMVRLH